MWIYFDMDGTIVDLYETPNWLDYLRSENVLPYKNAAPMADLEKLVKLLKTLNVHVGIISWCAKNSTAKYAHEVRNAKLQWLEKFFPIAEEVHIVRYGMPKYSVVEYQHAILFDDEQQNVNAWNLNQGATAYKINCVQDIIDVLTDLM